VANPDVKVTCSRSRTGFAAAALSSKIMAPFEKLTAQYFPGVPVLPVCRPAPPMAVS
jgi:hypothetical protein